MVRIYRQGNNDAVRAAVITMIDKEPLYSGSFNVFTLNSSPSVSGEIVLSNLPSGEYI